MISQKHAYINWLVQQQRCIYYGDAAGECGCDRKGERMKSASSDMYRALHYAKSALANTEGQQNVLQMIREALAKAEGREVDDVH
jgi:hypothetical protein